MYTAERLTSQIIIVPDDEILENYGGEQHVCNEEVPDIGMRVVGGAELISHHFVRMGFLTI